VQVSDLLSSGTRSISQAGRMSSEMILGTKGLVHPKREKSSPLTDEEKKVQSFYNSKCILKILGKDTLNKRFEEIDEEEKTPHTIDEELMSPIEEITVTTPVDDFHSPATVVFKVIDRERSHHNYLCEGNGILSTNPPAGHYDPKFSVIETSTSTPNIDWSKQVKKTTPKRIMRSQSTLLRRSNSSLPNMKNIRLDTSPKHGLAKLTTSFAKSDHDRDFVIL
jgi:hypothetical protein